MRSPLIVTQRETDTTLTDNPTFRYVVRVKVWTGVIASPPSEVTAELIRTVNPQGLGTFNVAPILEDFFEADNPMLTTALNTAGTANVQLTHGYIVDGTFNSESTGDTFQVTDGYAIQQQLINQYENATEVNDCDKILTPINETYTVDDNNMWLHVYRGLEQIRNIRYGDGQGNEFDVAFSAPNPPTTADQSVYRFPITPALVQLLADGAGVVGWNPIQFINVQLIDTDADLPLDEVKVYIQERVFCDFPVDNIAYVNRYGVWDYIQFKGKAVDTIAQSRTNYDRRITSYFFNVLQYESGASQAGTIGVKGTKRITLNTGYVPEVIGEKIQDLLLSKIHYSDILGQNLKLVTGSLEIQKKNQEDLINYAVDFELAGNLIQDIE